MTSSELRSLDRYITERGAALADVTNDARRVKIMGILATVYGLLGAGELSLGLAVGGAAHTVFLIQSAFWLATGGIMASIRGGMKWRMRQKQQAISVPITPEAKLLIQKLLTHLYGWPFSRVHRRLHYRRQANQEGNPLPESLRCSEVLNEEIFTLLEAAAQQANRILGMLDQAHDNPNSPLKEMAPSITAATDEAMSAIFDTAAQIEKFPENKSHAEALVQSQIADLQALAEQVEQLNAVTTIRSTTRLHTVLETLRADLVARQELNESENKPAQPASVPTVQPTEEEQPLINRLS